MPPSTMPSTSSAISSPRKAAKPKSTPAGARPERRRAVARAKARRLHEALRVGGAQYVLHEGGGVRRRACAEQCRDPFAKAVAAVRDLRSPRFDQPRALLGRSLRCDRRPGEHGTLDPAGMVVGEGLCD